MIINWGIFSAYRKAKEEISKELKEFDENYTFKDIDLVDVDVMEEEFSAKLRPLVRFRCSALRCTTSQMHPPPPPPLSPAPLQPPCPGITAQSHNTARTYLGPTERPWWSTLGSTYPQPSSS